ncbi:MAG: DEAD/DEAH box helicase [Candidatus Bathyarchaeia archaeon]
MKRSVFDLLAKPIRKLLVERGFSLPTPPQSEAIPVILEGKNLLLIAPAGSGKTEAALLPILHMLLLHPRGRGIKLLYITPLRALNRDLLERLQWWCRSLDLKVSVRHGDTVAEERRLQTLSPPDIMVTTPETLQILLLARRIGGHLKAVKWVVVDEVHEIADNKRGAQLSLTLERLRLAKGGGFQLVGLSATVGSPEEAARFLVGAGRPCEVRDLSAVKKMVIDVHLPAPSDDDSSLGAQLYTRPEVAARLRLMRRIVEEHNSTLVFTNTRPTAEILANRLKVWDLDFPAKAHHGSLSAHIRLQAEKGIRSGSVKAIVCTSSLELGIDIGAVDFCIQYGSPRQVTRLLQRIGRSGHRVGETAKGAIIALDPDDAIESLVIKARSQKGDLEAIRIPEKPYDVLMHSLMAMAISHRSVSTDEALDLFRKAYPFRNLTREETMKILKFMETLGLVRINADGSSFSRPLRGGRAFSYYYENLSTIPKARQYLVVNDEDEAPLGILDEEFIVKHGEPGVKFVMGGSVWRILQIFRDKVYVKADDDSVGAIPSWIGEEIPVPFSIAQEVGRIKRVAEELADRGFSPDQISERIAGEYGADTNILGRALESVILLRQTGIPLPTDNRVVIESFQDLLIIHAHFGTLVNRALGIFVSNRLSESGTPVSLVSTDPYRVIIRSEAIGVDELSDALKKGPPGMEGVFEWIVESRFFKWRIVQAARGMGVLEKDAEVTGRAVDLLVKTLGGTPAFEEALREVLTRDLDLEGATAVMEKIRAGSVHVVPARRRLEPLPISSDILTRHDISPGPASSDRRSLIVAAAKARLLSSVRTFICAGCKNYAWEEELRTLPDRPRCSLCGSTAIGMVEEEAEDISRILSGPKGGAKLSKLLSRIKGSARLISEYGKPAAVALAGNGVTTSVAEEILKEPLWPTSRFYERILEAERRALARRFGGRAPS